MSRSASANNNFLLTESGIEEHGESPAGQRQLTARHHLWRGAPADAVASQVAAQEREHLLICRRHRADPAGIVAVQAQQPAGLCPAMHGRTCMVHATLPALAGGCAG